MLDIDELRRQYDELVAAEVGSNADDEHDPEGVTLAFERQQLLALIQRAEQQQRDKERGTTGFCDVCGVRIPAERLEARPYARTCVDCASVA